MFALGDYLGAPCRTLPGLGSVRLKQIKLRLHKAARSPGVEMRTPSYTVVDIRSSSSSDTR